MTTPEPLDRYFESLRAAQSVSADTPSYEMLDAVVRGELDAAGADRIHGQLLTDPEARARHRRVVAAHHAADRLAAPSVGPMSARRRVLRIFAAAAIVVATVAIGLWFVPFSAESAHPLDRGAFLAIVGVPLKGAAVGGVGPVLNVRASDTIAIRNDGYGGDSSFVALSATGAPPIERDTATPSIAVADLFGAANGPFVVLFAPRANRVKLASARERGEQTLRSLGAESGATEIQGALVRAFRADPGDVHVLITACEVLP